MSENMELNTVNFCKGHFKTCFKELVAQSLALGKKYINVGKAFQQTLTPLCKHGSSVCANNLPRKYTPLSLNSASTVSLSSIRVKII